jgi:hypothetical protein
VCVLCVRARARACVIITGTIIRSLVHSCDYLEDDFSLEVSLHDSTYFLVFLSLSGHMPN